jgi:hypothetical protein
VGDAVKTCQLTDLILGFAKVLRRREIIALDSRFIGGSPCVAQRSSSIFNPIWHLMSFFSNLLLMWRTMNFQALRRAEVAFELFP